MGFSAGEINGLCCVAGVVFTLAAVVLTEGHLRLPKIRIPASNHYLAANGGPAFQALGVPQEFRSGEGHPHPARRSQNDGSSVPRRKPIRSKYAEIHVHKPSDAPNAPGLYPYRGSSAAEALDLPRLVKYPPSFALFIPCPPKRNEGDITDGKKQGEKVRGAKRGIWRLGRAIAKPFKVIGKATMKAARAGKRLFLKLIGFLRRKVTACQYCSQVARARGKNESGSPVVARAVARVLQLKQQGKDTLEKTETMLDSQLPRGEDIAFESMCKGEKLVFRRGPIMGSGYFGIVASFTSSDGEQYAGKLFVVQHSLEHTMELVTRHVGILSHLPPKMNAQVASRRLQLVLPLCVVRKSDAGSQLLFPGSKPMLNSIILSPLLSMDLTRLAGNLYAERPVDNAVLLSVTQQAVTAVKDLHSLKLVHLDIKPANFLVSKGGRILLADLDGVKPIGAPALPLMFTASYVSPELASILLAPKAAETATTMDAWQLGITLYALWCINLPFHKSFPKADSMGCLEALAKLTDEMLSFDSVCTGLMPGPVLDLITAFLKVDPNLRLTPTEAAASHPAMFLPVPEREEKVTPTIATPSTDVSGSDKEVASVLDITRDNAHSDSQRKAAVPLRSRSTMQNFPQIP